MQMRQIGLIGAVLLSSLFCWGATAEYSITGTPRWFKVKTEGQLCVVRDLATHRELGTLSQGDEFLSFGITENWVTLAYRGRVGYVSAANVEERYPQEKGEPVWRGFGPTLEDKVKQTKKELLDLAMESNRLLNPDLKKAPQSNQPGGVSATGQPLSGVQNYVRENLTPERGRGGGYY